jgi:hypothetical protein
MSFLSRSTPEVTPLSPGVHALLREMPCGVPPADLRARVVAAFDRASRESHAAPVFERAWSRLAIGGVAAAAAAVVLVFGGVGGGGGGRAPDAVAASVWEQVHPSAPVPASVRVVDDPNLAGLAAVSLASLDPLEGP